MEPYLVLLSRRAGRGHSPEQEQGYGTESSGLAYLLSQSYDSRQPLPLSADVGGRPVKSCGMSEGVSPGVAEVCGIPQKSHGFRFQCHKPLPWLERVESYFPS